MAGTWNNAFIWSTTLVLLTYVYLCYGCTPIDKPTTEKKISYSDYFISGKVLDIYTGGYDYDTLSTVKFEVMCIYKREELLNPIINITYAGYRHEPGLCISNNFTVGGEYLVFLDKVGKELRPSYNEEDASDPQILDDVAFYCEVESIEYPKGVNPDDLDYQCPEEYPDYENCIKHTTAPPTPEVTNVVVVKTMAPKGDKDKDKTDVSDETKTNQLQTGSLEGSVGRVAVSLGVTALCLVLSVF